MKILILEDDNDKAQRIISVLSAINCSNMHIEVTGDVASARESLDNEFFDLLIIDIRVPFRKGELADDKGGIHLLKEIIEDEQHKRPRYVVGISGAEDLYDESNLIFHSHGWALLRYSPAKPEWADSLRYFVDHIVQLGNTQEIEDQSFQKADVVILTALEYPEFTGVKSIFPELKGPRPMDSKTLIWEGDINLGTKKIRIVACSCWQMGLTASALLIERLLTKFNPQLISMTGICAGYRDAVSLGDIIVATQSWEWQGGKIVDDKSRRKLLPAPESFRPSQEIITALSLFKSDKQQIDKILEQCLPTKFEKSWNLHFGPVLSGLSVISSEREMIEIRSQHRKVLGIEMEAYSIYAAANFHPTNPKCIVIKGVCDFGDETKVDDFQKLSSFRSASVLRALLASASCNSLFK